MANSKIFRSAQNRSPGMGNSKDGYFNFPSGIKAIQKTQVKKCEPYSLLMEVCKKTGIKSSEIYLKIIFSSMHGQIKLLVTSGKNKDQASQNKSFVVIADIQKNKIQAIVPISRKLNDSATKEKSKKSSNSGPTRKSSTPGSKKTSARRFKRRSRN